MAILLLIFHSLKGCKGGLIWDTYYWVFVPEKSVLRNFDRVTTPMHELYLVTETHFSWLRRCKLHICLKLSFNGCGGTELHSEHYYQVGMFAAPIGEPISHGRTLWCSYILYYVGIFDWYPVSELVNLPRRCRVFSL